MVLGVPSLCPDRAFTLPATPTAHHPSANPHPELLSLSLSTAAFANPV